MNTISITLTRLTALAAALQSLQDNYGIRNEAAFNEQKGELADIIANVDITPPAPPVTVEAVIEKITANQLALSVGLGASCDGVRMSVDDLRVKVDALVALANSAGEPVAA